MPRLFPTLVPPPMSSSTSPVMATMVAVMAVLAVMLIAIVGDGGCGGGGFAAASIIRTNDSPTRPQMIPAANLAQPLYAPWAHEPWIWLNNHIQNQTAILDVVQGYLSRDIPVGAVDIDSEWSTGINNFIWDTKKFPTPVDMINSLHSINVKVLLWITSMVNDDSSNYNEGVEKGYFVRGALDKIKWWHGKGKLLDYTNPEAVAWWHKQMDLVLSIGVDGWKCDGTDPFIMELVYATGHDGHHISYREYADLYYGDFYNYTNAAYGGNKLIMSRPVDSYDNILYLDFSPRSVVFSGWVGDQDPNFAGLRDAMNNVIHSALHNYVGFGSDIGGYRSSGGGGGPFGRDVLLFMRWFQYGAFLPLMENGGGNEHRPWIFDEGTGKTTVTDTYRVFAVMHHQLAPFFLTTGTQAYFDGTSIIHPLAEDRFEYTLGQAIFVAPFLDNSTTLHDVQFPKDSSTWSYFFNTSQVYSDHVDSFDCEYTRFPVFVRKSAMVPLQVDSHHAGFLADPSIDATGTLQRELFSRSVITFLIIVPDLSDRIDTISVPVYELGDGGGVIGSYSYDPSTRRMTITVTAHSRPVSVIVRGVSGSACSRIVDELQSSSGDESTTTIVETRLTDFVNFGAHIVEESSESVLLRLQSTPVVWYRRSIRTTLFHHDDIVLHLNDVRMGASVTIADLE